MREIIDRTLAESAQALDDLRRDAAGLAAIERAAQAFIATFRAGGRAFSCGNGGSMSDAMHFAEELTARYRKDRAGLPATAISDAGHISCVGNDYGYDFIFSRYIEAHARAGDALLAISTSGTSRNILKAAEVAKARGARVVALTGRRDSALGKLADIDVCTPGGAFADRVQELHIKVIHIWLELIERDLFPENYR